MPSKPPSFPGDVIAALEIHAAQAEKRAGHPLFDPIDWKTVVGRHNAPSTGDWIRVMHAALRRKARCEAAGETVFVALHSTQVRGEDLLDGQLAIP